MASGQWFHILPDGVPRRCSAKEHGGKCRFGEDEPHYRTVEEASKAYEEKMSAQSFGRLKKAARGVYVNVSSAPQDIEVGGSRVRAVSSLELSGSTREKLRQASLNSEKMYELPASAAPLFREQVRTLKNNTKWHACVHVYEEGDEDGEYRDMRCFTTADGKAGFAVKGDGDVVSVFNNDPEGHPGIGQSLVLSAVAAGGKELDCFDTVLPKIYAKAGFREYDRVEWNDEYKPDGWKYETYEKYNHGRPNVVFMKFEGFQKIR